MKTLITTFSSATAGQSYPSESFKFIQDAAANAVKQAFLGLYLKTYNTNDIVAIWGCENSGTGLNYVISAGAVYYNGEIYEVDAISFTAAGGQVACATTIDTYESFDPIIFSDLTPHSVHRTRKVTFVSGPAGGSGVSNYIGDFSAIITANRNRNPMRLSKSTQNTGAASTSYTVQFDTVVYDADTIMNTGNGQFTPKKGWQNLSVQLTCAPNSSYTGQISVAIYRDTGAGFTLFDTVSSEYWNGTMSRPLNIVNYPINGNGNDKYKIVTLSSSTQYDINSALISLEPVNTIGRV